MNQWIDCNVKLPEVDYDNQKTSVKVKIKNFGKEKNCYFRHVINENVEYGIFYNRKDGTIYRHVTHWMPLPTAPKKNK
jgi:hypothetical protein